MITKNGSRESHFPWSLSLVNSKVSRESVPRALFSNSHQYLPQYESIKSLDDAFKYLSKPDKNTLEVRHAGYFDHPSAELPSDQDIEERAICLESRDITKNQVCKENLERIRIMTNPLRSGMAFIFTDAWKAVTGSNDYQEGLRLTALKIRDRLASANPQNGNIFEDLISAFEQSGKDRKTAIEMAWNTMAVISNHGPATMEAVRILEPTPTQTGVALGIIGGALSTIDYKNLHSGMPMYSLPKNIESHCDNSKPYHFWLAAYVAHQLVTKYNQNPSDAAHDSFIPLKLYHLLRSKANANFESDDQKKRSLLFAKKPYDPVHQVIRMDLAYNAAGVQFGSNFSADNSVNINIDKGIVALLENSEITEPIDTTNNPKLGLVESFLRFRQVFHPNVAVDAVVRK
jgi:hypothetical protein